MPDIDTVPAEVHVRVVAENERLRAALAGEPRMRELWLEVDDALDDLPRYMAVTNQSKEGWLPGSEDAPSMETCLSVNDVRRLLRAKLRGRAFGSTGGAS